MDAEELLTCLIVVVDECLLIFTLQKDFGQLIGRKGRYSICMQDRWASGTKKDRVAWVVDNIKYSEAFIVHGPCHNISTISKMTLRLKKQSLA